MYFKAAEMGDADAIDSLGWMYESGKGTTQNIRLAVECYMKAALKGSSNASNSIANYYAIGELNMPWDMARARQWAAISARPEED